MYFGERRDGTFVEVGAHDGEFASNTSCLADLGWRGFYIEPVPRYAEACRRRHAKNPNVTVSEIGIGDRSERTTIHIGGALSTLRPDSKSNYQKLDWSKHAFAESEAADIDLVTLQDYLRENRLASDFELLVVDVEGYEWRVLSTMDLSVWRPRMVIIELHDQNPDYEFLREECNLIVEKFTRADYKVIYKDFTNTVYVPRSSFPSPLKR